MAAIDRLSPEFRALVHEFGWVIVRDMRADGHRDAAKLRAELEVWRARKQAEWAMEIPYARRANAG